MTMHNSPFHKKTDYCEGTTTTIEQQSSDPMFSKFCRIAHLRKIRDSKLNMKN